MFSFTPQDKGKFETTNDEYFRCKERKWNKREPLLSLLQYHNKICFNFVKIIDIADFDRLFSDILGRWNQKGHFTKTLLLVLYELGSALLVHFRCAKHITA